MSFDSLAHPRKYQYNQDTKLAPSKDSSRPLAGHLSLYL